MEGVGHDAVQEPVKEKRETVTPSYVLVMDEKPETWVWPTGDEVPSGTYYITAKHPGLNEDKINNAKAPQADVDQRARTASVSLTPALEAAFVEKCVQQIIDFAIPASKEGEQYVAHYKEAQGGDNFPNRQVYTSLLRVKALRVEVEKFLDKVAGRDDLTQEDFADLGEGQGT